MPDGDNGESFQPVSFLDAVKQVVPKGLRKGGGRAERTAAQPATGTEEDRVRVTFLDKRERIIGWVLGTFMAVLAIASYFSDRHYIDKGHPKITAQVHSSATYILVVGLVLAALQIGATFSKRRALLGFALILSVGIGLNLFTIVYFGVGIWMVFRALRKPRPAMATAGAGGAGGTAVTSRASPNGTRTRARARSGTPSTPRARPAPPPSKRYTPPKPAAEKRTPTAAAKTEEGGNKLTGWLKRRQAGVR